MLDSVTSFLVSPSVSIIMPVYNASSTLERAIRSFSDQTREDIELITVNDGSTDNSLEILQSLSSEDPRIRVFSTSNQGVSSARNYGLARARGKTIMFLDADDAMDAGMVDKLSGEIEQGFDLVVCGYKALGSKVSFSQHPCEKKWKSTELDGFVEELQGCSALNMLWNKAFRADFIRGNGLQFDPTISNGEDYYFIIAYLSLDVQRFVTLRDDLYLYELSPDGLTVNSKRADVVSGFARVAALDALFDSRSLSKRAVQQAMLQFAYTLLSNSDSPRSHVEQIREQPLFSKLSGIKPSSLKYRVFLSLLKRDNVALTVWLISLFRLIKKLRGRSYSW